MKINSVMERIENEMKKYEAEGQCYNCCTLVKKLKSSLIHYRQFLQEQ